MPDYATRFLAQKYLCAKFVLQTRSNKKDENKLLDKLYCKLD
jgi:hypothetical protein